MAAAPKSRSQQNKNWLDWYDSIVFAAVVIMLLFTFVARNVRVDGHSMDPTLSNGQRMFISSLPYTPHYGDIVVIDQYTSHGQPLVKRVIGMGGDTIDIDFESGIVYRNGEALEEPYTAEPTYLWEGVDFPLTVPERELFVMGDNRNNSSDSRDPGIGCIDVRNVLGKKLF